MWSSGTGAEVMQRIAAAMVGGIISAPFYQCSSSQLPTRCCGDAVYGLEIADGFTKLKKISR